MELIDTTPEKNGVGGNAWLRVVLGEGRSRQVRKMLEAVGHKVSKLRRVAIGPLRDKSLPPGGFRDLALAEVAALRALEPAPKPRSASASKSGQKPAPKSAPEVRSQAERPGRAEAEVPETRCAAETTRRQEVRR